MAIEPMTGPWSKVYMKSGYSLEEVKSGSVAMVIMSPQEPEFIIEEEMVSGLACVKSVSERVGLLKNLLYFAVFPKLSKLLNSVRRVLRADGVFIFNVGCPDVGSGFGGFLKKVNLRTAGHFYPLWWAEFLMGASRLYFRVDLTVLKAGTIFSTQEQIGSGVIPNIEHFFVFSKGERVKFHPERLPDKVCYSGWISMVDRLKVAKDIYEEYGNVPGGVPTPFDEGVVSNLITIFSDEGDTILDPMAGTGTIGKIAGKLQRNSILYEIKQVYEPVIRKRVESEGARILEVEI